MKTKNLQEKAAIAASAGSEPVAINREALIDAITQGLHGTWHCTRVWEAWHVGTMSQDDFEPVDESDTPAELADAVLALLPTHPSPPEGMVGGWTALPVKRTGDRYELLGHKRDTPGGTQYVVRRTGFSKPTTLHHSCHVEIIKDPS